jgi:hypothetical protein
MLKADHYLFGEFKMWFFKTLWRLAFVCVLLFSIALNGSMFVGGVIYKAASSAFEIATGSKSLATKHADEVATQKATVKRLRSELDDPLARKIVFKGQRVAAREAVESTTDRISRRAVKSSSREVGSMFVEAIPYAGVAVIAGVTALELKDLCDTMKDMNALRRAFSPDNTPTEDQTTVCAVSVPTKDQLWDKIKASPQSAWAATTGAVPTWEQVQEFNSEITLDGTWRATVDGATGAWRYTKNAAGSLADGAQDAANGTWEWFTTDDDPQADE